MSLIGQNDVWQTAVYASDEWKYMPGSASIPENWNEVDFDDSSWDEGQGGIGYGDGDDRTIISSTMSLFMRRTFTLSDKSKIIRALFSADYDDAYIAYINGVEISRENISGTGAWNSGTNGEREARIYMGGGPSANFLSNNLDELLIDGENVLAVQTHNWSTTSSDLTSLYWLSFLSTEAMAEFGEIDDILNTGGFNAGGFNSTLPIIRINTNNVEIPNEPKIEGDMAIVWNGEGVNNNSEGEANEFQGNIRIEKRGQSSLGLFPKVSYLLETVDADGEDIDVSFLNFPEEEDFILHGPYSDKTLLRNVLIFDIANKIGQYATRTRYVELMVNGIYEGIYVVMERIKRDENRVDVAKLRAEDISGDELTGGYIFKIDKDAPDWFSAYDVATAPGKKLEYQYVYPRRDDIQPEQENYIQSYVDSFEQVMLTPGGTIGGKSYLDFIDLESFVDHFLLVEFAMDIDAYRFSTYMHKDKDSNGGKLKCGPLWDFNLSFGNANFCDGWNPNGYMYFRNCDQGNPFWWGRLFSRDAFADHAQCRWQELREGILNENTLFEYIDDQVALLNPSLDRNYERWPIINEWIWPNPEVQGSYDGEVDFLKDFITDRLRWMDNNLFGVCDSTLVIEPAEGFDFVVSPNPASSELNLIFENEIVGDIAVELYDMIGKRLTVKNTISADNRMTLDISAYPPGVYNLILIKDGEAYETIPVVFIN